jgi:hypothetical protein
MAHPKRQRWIPGLVDALDREPTVVWDRNNDRWDTGRRSLLAYDPDATHHLVVQDDALVCRDLVAGLEQAVAHTGDHPLGLYIGMVRPSAATVARKVRDAQTFGARFVKMDGPWWGVGIVVPTGHIEDLVRWADRRSDIANYDKRISRWYRTVKGLDCWYPFPSLVEHRHGEENPSLIPGRSGTNRRAWQFLGTDRSALNIDWTYRPPEDGMATFRNLRAPHLEPVTTPEGSASFVRLSRLPAIWERVDTPAEPEPAVTVGDPDPDPSVSVDAFHTGAGWYTLPDGSKVRGRDAALAAL